MKSDADIVKQFKKHKGISDRGLSAQRNNSVLADAFVVGDYLNRDLLDWGTRKRISVQFSKPAPYVNAVHGFMAQNRRKAKYVARIEEKEEQEKYTRAANAIHDYIRKNARADQIESVQNRQMLIKGYGAVETALSYNEGYSTRDPNGEIIMGDVTDECFWDAMSKDTNLLSARWVGYRKSYSLDEAEKLFNKPEKEFETVDVPDDKTGYRFDPSINTIAKIEEPYEWDSRTDRTVWVYFYQWKEIETFYRAENPVYQITDPNVQLIVMSRMDEIEATAKEQDSMFKFDATAEVLTFDADTKKKLEELFEDRIECFDYPRSVFYTAVISGEKVFKKYRNQSQQGFTVKFKTGYWDNTHKIWIGMVNPMMEPTKYYNKFLTELMYTIAANSKGGWMVEDGALDDEQIKDFERDINKTDAVVYVANGALVGGKIKEKKSAFAPTGYDQLLAIAEAGVNDASTIDPAFLGSSENKMQTAQLQSQIITQVRSTLSNYFDSEVAYSEEHSRMMLDLMAVYAENNQGGIIRIAGEEDGSEFMRISPDAFAPEYDVDIVEAPQTSQEKMEMAQVINAIGDKLMAVGDSAAGKAAYSIGVKYLPIESADKREFRELFKVSDDPQVAQLQALVQQLQSEQSKAQMRNIESMTAKNMASVQKTSADIQKLGADIENTASDTALNAEKIEQISLENSLIPLTTLDKLSVNV